MPRERSDWRSLAIVAAALAVLAAPLVVALDGPAFALRTVAAIWLCFTASVINHNHQHANVFAARAPNVAFNVLLALARGHSATGIIVPHNLNHHVHEGDAADWIRPALAGAGPGWLRIGRFVALASASMARRRWEEGAPRLPREWRTSALLEKAALWAAVMSVAWGWGLVAVAEVLLLPWAGGLVLLVAVNLLQHDGLDAPLARDFKHPVLNWLLFNNGYHAVHHAAPGLHWSRLPGEHSRRVREGTLVEVAEPFLVYVWRTLRAHL
jgi:fatty acid desaturase